MHTLVVDHPRLVDDARVGVLPGLSQGAGPPFFVERLDQLAHFLRRADRAKFAAEAVDGVIGPETRQAIREYQKDRGLPVNGMITPELLSSLKKSYR